MLFRSQGHSQQGHSQKHSQNGYGRNSGDSWYGPPPPVPSPPPLATYGRKIDDRLDPGVIPDGASQRSFGDENDYSRRILRCAPGCMLSHQRLTHNICSQGRER